MKIQDTTTWADVKDSSTQKGDSWGGQLQSDVVIIGGGLAGILSAYLLSKEGKKVIIFEKGKVGEGYTMYTTAFITQSIDTDFSSLINSFGLADAKKITGSHKEAIELIARIVKEEGIECDFERTSNHIYALKENELSGLEDEVEAAKKLGVKAKFVRGGAELGFKNVGYMETMDQAKFHPIKFVYALKKKMLEKGVVIFENTKVEAIESDGAQVVVKTAKGEAVAQWGIVATYQPFNKPKEFRFKKVMYKSYVFEVDVFKDQMKEGTFEDMNNPYHYMRIDKSNKGYRMIIGGEDHRNDVPINANKNYNALKQYLDFIFEKGKYTITKKWDGGILEPIDGLAYIGPLNEKAAEKNILYATGFSGNGMTYSGIAARIFADTVMDRENPLKKIYAPNRKQSFKLVMTKAKDFGGEFIGGALKNFFTQSSKPL